MSERQDTTISNTLKSKGSICRILKSQKIISLANISLPKPLNLIDLLYCFILAAHGTFFIPGPIIILK